MDIERIRELEKVVYEMLKTMVDSEITMVDEILTIVMSFVGSAAMLHTDRDHFWKVILMAVEKCKECEDSDATTPVRMISFLTGPDAKELRKKAKHYHKIRKE